MAKEEITAFISYPGENRGDHGTTTIPGGCQDKNLKTVVDA